MMLQLALQPTGYAGNGTGGATFNANFLYTGADTTLDFLDDNDGQIGASTFSHKLVFQVSNTN